MIVSSEYRVVSSELLYIIIRYACARMRSLKCSKGNYLHISEKSVIFAHLFSKTRRIRVMQSCAAVEMSAAEQA